MKLRKFLQLFGLSAVVQAIPDTAFLCFTGSEKTKSSGDWIPGEWRHYFYPENAGTSDWQWSAWVKSVKPLTQPEVLSAIQETLAKSREGKI